MGRVRLRESEVRASRLPEVCMACGQPSETHVKKNFSWFPPWVGVTILAGLLPYVILAAVLTKRMTVDIPLCTRHRGHFWKRTLLIWLVLLAWLGLSFLSFVLTMALLPERERSGAMGITCVAFLGGLVAAIIVIWFAQNTGIRPKEITDHDITLVSVHDDFIDALEAFREERRRRRDSDDDFEDRRPSRRRPVDEPDDVEGVDDRPPRRDAFRTDRGDEDRPRRRRDEDIREG